MLARWPREWPLAALCSGETGTHGRWTILARPTRRLDEAEAVRRLVKPLGKGIYAKESPPFAGGVLGVVSYDFGRVIEPKARARADGGDPQGWPKMTWFECPDALVYDHGLKAWWKVGGIDFPRAEVRRTTGWRAGGLRSGTERAGYIAAVERALAYIRAGDVYQVNLAHRLGAGFEGSPRELFGAMMAQSRPWYGAYLEWETAGVRRIVASQSPELFLSYDPASRDLVTRPMKGTRPAGEAAALNASAKDRAELAMIVDLMRNDLGRVCRLGSVRVEEARVIERHGAGRSEILQATATVRGELPPGASAWDVLRGTFPGGSVTGAPKIRAMQIIDELEPVRRGPYCGAIGFVSDSGHMAFNLAIRTALLSGRGTEDGGIAGEVSYSVGAGIVADSRPEGEWEETMQKAAGFGYVLAAGFPS